MSPLSSVSCEVSSLPEYVHICLCYLYELTLLSFYEGYSTCLLNWLLSICLETKLKDLLPSVFSQFFN